MRKNNFVNFKPKINVDVKNFLNQISLKRYSQKSGEKFLENILKSPYNGLLARDIINNMGIKLVIGGVE